jgi:undecaprenyl diphosphate synthase
LHADLTRPRSWRDREVGVEEAGCASGCACRRTGRQAARHLARQVERGELAPQDINSELFTGCLAGWDLPDPDLLIRTSGEQRLSGFMLWQMAYTEYVFVDCFWPDFGAKQLDLAIEQYSKRHRRYGLYSVAA